MNIKPKHQNLLLYNIMPISCISFFIVLGLLTINPSISTNKAHAEDDYLVYDADSDINVDDNNITTYNLTEDGVVLEWDNRDSDYQTITGSNSEVLYRYNRFRVTAENIKKYQILANIADTANGTNGNKLIGYTNSEYNIPNGYSIDSISDANGIVGKDLTSSTTSQWGYAITIGEVTTTDNLANLTYKAVPSAASSDIGLTDNVTELNNQAFTIAFAANIADDKPAGSYRASVGVSVVVEPGAIPWDKLVYMQDMSSEACASQTTPAASATTVPTKTLIDSRDTSTSYTIAKLADGNCWMTQNLALPGETILTINDSDLDTSIFTDANKTYTIPVATTSKFSDATTNDKNGTAIQANQQIRNAADPDPNKYGAYYSWCTATAGTCQIGVYEDIIPNNNHVGNTGNIDRTIAISANQVASSSICPKNWQLPTSNNTDPNRKSFSGLITAYSLENNEDGVAKLTSTPLNFVYSGNMGYVDVLNGTGKNGYYLSSIAATGNYVYGLSFQSQRIISPSTFYRSMGQTIRCVAR